MSSPDSLNLRWWFVYGPGRSGTTYLSLLISTFSDRLVSDWGVAYVLANLDKVHRLNVDRYLHDLSVNILDSAARGGGKELDLIYKQANCSVKEYEYLSKMFGAPERTIFCSREPAGYIASATKKFEDTPLARLQDGYASNLEKYNNIKGDIIDYGEYLTKENVREFILSSSIGGGDKLEAKLDEFKYSGVRRDELVTDAMLQAYSSFKARNIKHIDDFEVKSYQISGE